MKFKSLAVSLMLIGSSTAFAQVTINAAGASAQIGQVTQIFNRLICAPNTVTEYVQLVAGTPPTVNGNLRAVTCTTKADLSDTNTAINNVQVTFNYSAIDGSASGVQFVARQQPRSFITINTTTCTITGTNVVNGSTITTRSCPVGAALTSANPVAGASDVEPALFFGLNTPAQASAITSTDLNNLTASANRAVIFGLAANCNLIAALQTAQGITPIACTGTGKPAVSTDLNDSNRPNVTVAQVRSIISGSAGAAVLGVPAGNMNYERRVNGSGTQAMSNIHFLNYPCALGTNAALTPVAGGQSTFGVTHNAGSGSSNVASGIQNNTTSYGMGVLSLETAEASNRGYLRINGVKASRANVINGSYEFFGEETFQYNPNVATVNQVDLLNIYSAGAGSVATLNGLSTATAFAALPIATPSGVQATDDAFIMQGFRSGNNCAPQQLF
jgi:hypothetical protein